LAEDAADGRRDEFRAVIARNDDRYHCGTGFEWRDG
jgi:hypothetical protein